MSLSPPPPDRTHKYATGELSSSKTGTRDQTALFLFVQCVAGTHALKGNKSVIDSHAIKFGEEFASVLDFLACVDIYVLIL